ncbi:hypothetical protein CHS0354_024959 [Potamilus streckersoni]|uniref:Uncharacterized protein n=1 Tax=Potamilus streckersoni TaxID=2493646 RepID=A0AAE0T1G2_9BIVA|nr:hypothetical protein CHS0354_024959 [Potamilus streckersoni]
MQQRIQREGLVEYECVVARIPMDLNGFQPQNISTCTQHFVSGKPSSDPCHPDYILSIYRRTADSSLKGAKRLNRYNSAQKRKFGLVKNSNASKNARLNMKKMRRMGKL